MLEISIPELQENTKNTKDLVFGILVENKSLSLMQIYRKIIKGYNVSITYQAVRKATESLLAQKVLIKTKKAYCLNKKWVLNLKSFSDKLLQAVEKKQSVHDFTADMISEDYASYTLNSLFELDNFWGDILKYLADNLTSEEEKFSMNIGHYTWWMLINLGRESEILQHFKNKKIKTYYFWMKENDINKNIGKTYSDVGHQTLVKNLDSVPLNIAIDTVGDTVLQIKYPKEIIKKIQKYFEKYNAENANMSEITKIVHEPCKIQFTIFRNKEFARNFNKEYLSYFT